MVNTVPLAISNHGGEKRHVQPWLLTACLAVVLLTSNGCTLQPAYKATDLHGTAPPAWSVEMQRINSTNRPLTNAWWSELHDLAINKLVQAALADSPTLAEAVTRIDEARSLSGVAAAESAPKVGVSASVSRARQLGTSSSATILVNSSAVGPNFSWEIDLFGRVRQKVDAAQSRVDARTEDAAATRLSLAADVASDVLALRACRSTLSVLTADIASRERVLSLTRHRVTTGFATLTDEARALTGLASARSQLTSQQEQCARQTNALVALTGESIGTVHALTTIADAAAAEDPVRAFTPAVPAARVELPAEVLVRHPAVRSAEREAQAAWAEIGIAKAERLPRLDITALLTGQWLRMAGVGQHLTTWSLGPELSAPLFDGGSGAANVDAAEARYRRAQAVLLRTLRDTVQDVENALAGQVSAVARASSASDGLVAAQYLLTTSEARWRAGFVSQLELEDSRQQLTTMQIALIAARRDQAQAWIALVKATGGAVTVSTQERPNE